MKIRGLVIAAVVLAILSGVLYWSEHRKPAEEGATSSASASPAILKFDPASVTRVTLRKKGAEAVTLVKTSTGKWQITEPKTLQADDSTVSGMLSSLSSLSSDRVVEDQVTDLKQFGLDQPFLEAELVQKDNKTYRLLLGDDTPTSGMTYTMLMGSPQIYTISTFSKSSIDKTLNDLRDKRLLTVNSDKVSRVELVRKGQDIEFGRSKTELQIAKPKPLRSDAFQISDLVRRLTDAKMNLSKPENKDIASIFARAVPIATAKVTDDSGTQELQVRKDKDGYYAKSSAVDGVYRISSDLGQTLDKSLNDFRNKKLFDFGFNDPSKIELHIGPKAYFLSRSGQDWWSNGKKMDAGGVASVISKLRDLTASQFVDSGFANPAIEAIVTSGDGKQIERISFAQSNNSYLAKREDDSSLYQIDSGAMDDLQKAADAIKPAVTSGK